MRILCFFIGLVLLGVPLKAQQYDIPPYAEDYQIVTRDGAWCWFSDPRAVYVDNKMFGGFVDKEGSIWAFCYDPSSQERNQVKLKDKTSYFAEQNKLISQASP